MQTIAKDWGREEIWADTKHYTGKLLIFDAGASSSKHYHAAKDESWLIQDGLFSVSIAGALACTFGPGETLHLPPGTVHLVHCVEAGTIVEVSTPHADDDVFRLEPSRAAPDR